MRGTGGPGRRLGVTAFVVVAVALTAGCNKRLKLVDADEPTAGSASVAPAVVTPSAAAESSAAATAPTTNPIPRASRE